MQRFPIIPVESRITSTRSRRVPAIFHFGLLDKHIPQTVVEMVRKAHPEFAVYTYEADHAFNRDVGAKL